MDIKIKDKEFKKDELINLLDYKGYSINISLDDLERIKNWLREEHQIFIEIQVDKTTAAKFCYTISRFHGNPKNLSEKFWYWETELEYDCRKNFVLDRTYKEALYNSIFESIKLLKDVD